MHLTLRDARSSLCPAHVNTFQQGINQYIVSAFGDALISIVEIIIIIHKAERDTSDDECR